jgi:hypothetical protein
LVLLPGGAFEEWLLKFGGCLGLDRFQAGGPFGAAFVVACRKNAVDKVADLRRLRPGRVIVGGNDHLGEAVHQGVLGGREEIQLAGYFGGCRGGVRRLLRGQLARQRSDCKELECTTPFQVKILPATRLPQDPTGRAVMLPLSDY